jgi:hypothetical protein
VETSTEVSGIELFGTNEADFAVFGPFTANSSGTQTTSIEIDVLFPQGLYFTNSDGSFSSRTVTALFEYLEIDDTGVPIGSWTTLHSFTKTLATNKPQRFTIETAITAGRYQIRAQRTNARDLDTFAQDRIQWYQMRAILPDTKDYGDITLVAMKARASNNLNDQSRSRYNVNCIRKLPIWNGSVWSAVTETRNPAWAFADALRSVYGGNLADSKLDLAGLLTLASTFTAAGDNFDWVFSQRGSIWNALQLIARAGRASPVVSLTQFSMIRDEAVTVPVMAFTPNSIIKDSFEWQIKLQPEDDYDGIEIEYLDDTTNKQETIDCLVGSDAGTNTQNIRFPGVTDRDKAYQMGLYIRRQQIFQREFVTFKTGLEGAIPSFGDLITVSHDVPRWGAHGLVVSIAVDNKTVTLSESLNGIAGNSIAFRDKYGAVEGPYTCSKVAGNDMQIITDSAITQTNFLFEDASDPPAYFFGETNLISKDLLVTSTSTSTDDEVTITAKNYDSRVYDDESRTAAPLATASVPPAIPELPVVTGLDINPDALDLTKVTVFWDVALGARYYVLERSLDGTNWDQEASPAITSQTITVEPGLLYVRVAGVNVAQGPWAVYSESVGLNVRVTSNGDVRVDSTGSNRRVAT